MQLNRQSQQKTGSVNKGERLAIAIFVYGVIGLIGLIILAKLGGWAWDAARAFVKVVRG